jgi:heptosyltransferase II
MMQPLLTLLKRREPALRIEVLAPDWSAPLLGRMAEVDAVIANPFAHGQFRWSARRAQGRELRARHYDRAYVLPNSWKSALIPFFAGIPERIGYHGEARWGLLTRRYRLDTARHPRLVARYAALAGGSQGDLPSPHLQSDAGQRHATCAALGLSSDAAPVVFCPGAEYGPAKRWPAAHFAALAQKLGAGGTALPVWLVGSAKDQDTGDEIARLSGGLALNLCGRTSLAQAIDLIAGARAVVSNDSGLMHVAAALERPLVALYGSSDPGYTPPLSAKATILSRRLDCSPCFKRECPLGHLDCLAGLAPEQVMAALEQMT